MKNIFLLFIQFSAIIFAQYDKYPRPDEGIIGGGFGMNFIDGELYYRFSFRPEISFSNFGVGLDVNFDIDRHGNIRKENFNETSDYLSLIRYVRYGEKNDPVFIKAGALDYYTLGHGSIIQHYNNSPTYDNRRIGLVFDLDLGKAGIESIYSSFSPAGIFGIRAYARPLQFTTAADIPILGNLEVGASFVTDINKDAGILNGYFDSISKDFKVTQDTGSIDIFGFDIGLPIVKTRATELTLYADYAKIVNFGSGIATGIMFTFKAGDLLSASTKLERRFNKVQYLPSYFNSLHEVNRFNIDSSKGTFTSKALFLKEQNDNTSGWYGDLLIRVFSLFDIYGSYQRLDKVAKSGILNLRTSIEPEDASFVFRAGYDKVNIKSEKDIFILDDRSYLYSEFGYKPMQYILVSIIYSWTFTPVRNNDGRIIYFEPQKRVEPRISFIYPIEF